MPLVDIAATWTEMQPVTGVVVSAVAGVNVAQLSTSSGIGLRDIALALLGTFTILIIATRAVWALADEQPGKMLSLILLAIPVIGFAYFPDTSINILKGLFTEGTS